MNVYSAAQVAQRLPYEALIAGLRDAFASDIQAPLRSMYPINLASGSQVTLGLMPSWLAGEILATKLLTIFPDNVSQGLPTIHAQIVLFDGRTGIPTAVVDGTEVTRRRTAATSALAASYLANEHAEYLVVVGTGAQALHQALAHAVVRPIRRIGVWGRSPERAQAVVEALKEKSGAFSAQVVDDLEAGARQADVISCVTGACDPVVFGEWLKPGSFLDLVGSHTPDRRECDDEAVRRSRIYVDTLAGARAEAGDLLIPLRHGIIRHSDILGDLRALCRGDVAGRGTPGEITLFKSVGSALEDLTAARMVVATIPEAK
jgi:alanine dehydrogenase